MNIKFLPYFVKENINLYLLNMKDFEICQEFNKICDYKPSEYSNEKLIGAKERYDRRIENNKKELESYEMNLLEKFCDIANDDCTEYDITNKFLLDCKFYFVNKKKHRDFRSLDIKRFIDGHLVFIQDNGLCFNIDFITANDDNMFDENWIEIRMKRKDYESLMDN